MVEIVNNFKEEKKAEGPNPKGAKTKKEVKK